MQAIGLDAKHNSAQRKEDVGLSSALRHNDHNYATAIKGAMRNTRNRVALSLVAAGIFFGGIAPGNIAYSMPVGGAKAHADVVGPARKSDENSIPLPASAAPGPWKLVFDDEFSGTRLTTSKWSYCYAWGRCYAHTKKRDFEQKGYSVKQNCREGNGELELMATKGDSQNQYFTCIIQTSKHFDFTYGYVEARLWLPDKVDSWPAFWLTNYTTKGRVPAEIDIMEDYGKTEDTQYYHYHYPVGHIVRNVGSGIDITGATSGWHTYAVDWEPGSIRWYYDGKLVWQEENSVYNHKMYIVLDEVLDSFTPKPNVPATLHADYVRVWQHD